MIRFLYKKTGEEEREQKKTERKKKKRVDAFPPERRRIEAL